MPNAHIKSRVQLYHRMFEYFQKTVEEGGICFGYPVKRKRTNIQIIQNVLLT